MKSIERLAIEIKYEWNRSPTFSNFPSFISLKEDTARLFSRSKTLMNWPQDWCTEEAYV